MIAREAKLLNGTKEQYQAFDDAIRAAQFIRNKAVRYWMDNRGVGKVDLYKLCKDLAKEFAFALKLNSAAPDRQCRKSVGIYIEFLQSLQKRREKKGVS